MLVPRDTTILLPEMVAERLLLAVACLLTAIQCNGTDGKIIAAFVMPHGGIALDPNHFNSTNATSKEQAWEIHEACSYVGETIQQLRPDIIFLSTPHGIADAKNFVFYLNPVAEGYADTDNCQCPPCCYKVSAAVDANLSMDLAFSLAALFNVSGLSAFGPPGQSSEPFPLRWGEVIPLHFVAELNRTKVAIISHPSRRYTEDVSMTRELLKLGARLYELLEARAERVAVIVSADLAHTHNPDGPYGYSNASEPFDLACGQWAATLDEGALLVTAAKFVSQALSCGYTGLVLLHGMLTAGTRWQPRLLVNHHPSYYGMMVAQFLPTSGDL